MSEENEPDVNPPAPAMPGKGFQVVGTTSAREKHRCLRTMRLDSRTPTGTVIRCDCGRAWVLRPRYNPYSPGLRAEWGRAHWWTVWRAKRRAGR